MKKEKNHTAYQEQKEFKLSLSRLQPPSTLATSRHRFFSLSESVSRNLVNFVNISFSDTKREKKDALARRPPHRTYI